jgi:hypothetical protein
MKLTSKDKQIISTALDFYMRTCSGDFSMLSEQLVASGLVHEFDKQNFVKHLHEYIYGENLVSTPKMTEENAYIFRLFLTICNEKTEE